MARIKEYKSNEKSLGGSAQSLKKLDGNRVGWALISQRNFVKRIDSKTLIPKLKKLSAIGLPTLLPLTKQFNPCSS